jgi:hypothetical protein
MLLLLIRNNKTSLSLLPEGNENDEMYLNSKLIGVLSPKWCKVGCSACFT